MQEDYTPSRTDFFSLFSSTKVTLPVEESLFPLCPPQSHRAWVARYRLRDSISAYFNSLENRVSIVRYGLDSLRRIPKLDKSRGRHP
jgi:hypothetical protein